MDNDRTLLARAAPDRQTEGAEKTRRSVAVRYDEIDVYCENAIKYLIE